MSTFGSEFTYLRVGMDMLIGLRYIQTIMGVPLEGYMNIKVDNIYVVKNMPIPENTPNKRSNSIA